MAISPNGRRVAVSASTGNVVHVLRTRDGQEMGSFESGGSPHENVYIDGGRKILHASIGMVYSPLDQPEADPTKQERVFQIVDARTFKVLRRINVRKALDDRGLTRVSHAVRPLTLSPNERKIYFQVSLLPRLLRDEPPHRQDHPRQAAAEPRPGHPARAVPPRLRAPRHRDEPRRHQDLRRRHHVRLRDGGRPQDASSGAGCSSGGSSPTGSRRAPTAGAATSPGAAATRSPGSPTPPAGSPRASGSATTRSGSATASWPPATCVTCAERRTSGLMVTDRIRSCHQKRGDRVLRRQSARHVPAAGVPGHLARDPRGAAVLPGRSPEPAHLPPDGRAPRRGRASASSSRTPRWRTRSGSRRWW